MLRSASKRLGATIEDMIGSTSSPQHAALARRPRPAQSSASRGGSYPDTPSIDSYAAVLGSAFLCYAALGSVLRILPHYISHDLHGGPVGVGLAVGAPALTAVVTRPLGGRWADRVGPLRVLLVGALAMVLGALPALLGGFASLVLSRLVVGAGEGLMMSAAVVWLLRLGGPARRGRSMGHAGLANYAGLAGGPLLAAALGGEQHPQRVLWVAVVLPLAGALLALVVPRRPPAVSREAQQRAARASVTQVLGWTWRAGLGLMLVNVGYVALISFGASAIQSHGGAAAGLIVPIFAVVVIGMRTLAGSVPDRLGAERTVIVTCLIGGLGMVGVALSKSGALTVGAVALFATGQALAVPALGLMALRRAPTSQQGAAAGLFFAWWDAGVGLGGPLTGGVAALSGSPGALIAAALVVAITPLVAVGLGPPGSETPAPSSSPGGAPTTGAAQPPPA